MTSSEWNFADVWEAAADRFPDALACVHGDVRRTWWDFDRRADGIAKTMVEAGVTRQSRVAQLMRNSDAYLEVVYAAFKAALVPVNTNYRYRRHELTEIWAGCAAEVVVFDNEFAETVEATRPSLPGVKLWIEVGGDSGGTEWAVSYKQAASARSGRFAPAWGRSGDDLYLLYTGGTTGRPKGVMWRQDDMFCMLEEARDTVLPSVVSPDVLIAGLDRPGPTGLAAAPLMHGTASWFAMPLLSRGGTIITLTSHTFDPVELLDAIERDAATGLCIVGDAFASPIVERLEQDPTRWDLSSVRALISSGAGLSPPNRTALLRHFRNGTVVDGLGSSEAGPIAKSTYANSSESSRSTFVLGDHARVIDEAGEKVEPGSTTPGRLIVGGRLPLGYLNDDEATRSTFVLVDGRRYVVTGDWATISSDGSIVLLGRGSSCINTAGEKVYPEEVEDVLKSAPGVIDVGVVGVPHDRLGEAVSAVVVMADGANCDEATLIEYVKARLAGYKAPRRVVVVDSLGRHPNGKLDRAALRSMIG